MKRKKKVIYIIDTLQVAGAERSLVEIALNLTRFVPIFVHLYKGNMLQSHLEKNEIKVYSLNIAEKYGISKAVKELKKIYTKESPDIIHSTLYRADIVARKMKKFFPNIPLVGSFVNNSYTSLRYRDKGVLMKIKLWVAFRIDYYTSKNVDFFISNSETIKISEGGALNIPLDKIKVIYRGRNPRRFTNISKEEGNKLRETLGIQGKKVLVNVSRLISRKGQMDILKVMPKILLKFPNTVLIIAGDGPLKTDLRGAILKLGLENNVILLGRFSQIPELLSIADIFIYPSYAEGLPGALIEAMMASCVIINSNIGENLECVGKDSSMSYPVGNIVSLEKCIINVLSNPDEFRILGQTAKKVADDKFAIEKIALEYENTYEMILNNQNTH